MTDLEKANLMWCAIQGVGENGELLCLAHITEDRILHCPYKTKKDMDEAAYPCSDCEEANNG